MPALLVTWLVLACTGKPPVETGDDTGSSGDGKQRLTILHTNDWQSHVLGFGPNAEYTPDTTGDDLTFGGLARAKTLVDEIRGSTTHPVILLDGGDWMGGALFQELRASHAAELQMMEALGFDAITPGNHEEDSAYRDERFSPVSPYKASTNGTYTATNNTLGIRLQVDL